VWVSIGGERGLKGEPCGTELFCRFIAPWFRGKGHGLTLLKQTISLLEKENKLPLRVLPTSNMNRTYGGLADGQKLIVMNQNFWRANLASSLEDPACKQIFLILFKSYYYLRSELAKFKNSINH